jgi:hypothetical protein
MNELSGYSKATRHLQAQGPFDHAADAHGSRWPHWCIALADKHDFFPRGSPGLP